MRDVEVWPRRRLGAARLARALALVVTVAVSACSSGDSDEGRPAASDDPGVSHVHGLGVNPGDGRIFAATHYGLFSIPDNGPATRVADRFQDTMAFTVVGEDQFLGSGHPDIQDNHLRSVGKPPHLGLISSRDAGETWNSISLLGEADFHAIATVRDRIYAYDATGDRFMVSDDAGVTWDERVTGIGIVGLAASPSVTEVVLAVTPSGLEVSADGGRTFTPIAGAPRAALVSWPEEGALWSVNGEGIVWRSPGVGLPWVDKGRLPGEPEAFVATTDLLVAAVADSSGRTGIYTSDDSGMSWKLRYRDRPSA